MSDTELRQEIYRKNAQYEMSLWEQGEGSPEDLRAWAEEI